MADKNSINNNQIIIYNTKDGQTKIEVQMKDETVWLIQDQMAELFVKQNPPQWLTDIGTEEEQREHLKERILIHLFERFSFVK